MRIELQLQELGQQRQDARLSASATYIAGLSRTCTCFRPVAAQLNEHAK